MGAAVGHGADAHAGKKDMPAFAARSADAVKHTGRAGYGGRGGGASSGVSSVSHGPLIISLAHSRSVRPAGGALPSCA